MATQEVIIKRVQIPFLDLVVLLTKFSIAMIPAAIIFAIAGFILGAILQGLGT